MKHLFGFPAMIFLCILILLSVSCNTGKDNSTIAFSLEEKDLIPEGITFDPVIGQFFVSSIAKEKIVPIAKQGVISDFITTGKDSLMETLGMKVDATARRLWVLSNKTIEKKGYSSVHIYNIDEKAFIKKFTIQDTVPGLFNDLALTSKGDAYITDSNSGKIFHVDAGLNELSVFTGPDNLLRWVNGIVISPDDQIIYAAAGSQISTININTKLIRPIIDNDSTGTAGIDGLVFHKGALIGIVNEKKSESDMAVIMYRLGPDKLSIKERKLIDKGNPLFNIPTTCTMAGDDLYVLGNTSLRFYFQDKENVKGLFQNPLIFKYSL